MFRGNANRDLLDRSANHRGRWFGDCTLVAEYISAARQQHAGAESSRSYNGTQAVMSARSVREISAVLTALFAGAMLLIRAVLVPFWQRLSPDAFRAWFRDNSGRIEAVMFPLGGAATLSATAAAVVSRDVPPAQRRPVVLAAACTVGVIVVTVVVNEPANKQFNGHELAVDDTPALLARWRHWHTVRVLLGTAAAVSAVRGLSDHSH